MYHVVISTDGGTRAIDQTREDVLRGLEANGFGSAESAEMLADVANWKETGIKAVQFRNSLAEVSVYWNGGE